LSSGHHPTAWDRIVCGIEAEALSVLDEDREAACFVEKCADCFATVLARGSG
jgi:hypothetical protein